MLRRMNNTVMPVIAGLVGSLYSYSAYAEEVAEHGGGHEAITFMGDWLPRLVNFGIIAGVVVYFMRKPMQDFFAGRTAEIARAMQESRENREKALATLAEVEHRIKDMEAETLRMVSDAQARGEKDRLALVEEGKKITLEVQSQVQQGIAAEVEKAKSGLATEAALLSLELAEDNVKRQISAQDHGRIVKEYISSIGGKA